jgi:hypothetical protein
MAIPSYTVRVTNEGGKITAWIDKDNQVCIEQPNLPGLLGTGDNWATETDALAWAEEHAAQLTSSAEAVEAELIAKAEKEAQEAAARQAILDNASKMDEIHAMLTQLTSQQ